MARKPAGANVTIPDQLIEAIKNRRAIPFIGAGASKEARNAKGESPPNANQLRDILAKKFFNREIKNRDVMAVAEMAIERVEVSRLCSRKSARHLTALIPVTHIG